MTRNYPVIPAAEVQLAPAAPLLHALKIIEGSRARIALVVDSENRLIGSLTDGDIRRGLLAGCTLESPVSQAMYAKPSRLPSTSTRQDIIEAMRAAGIKQMPLVDADNILIGIAVYDMLTGFEPVAHSNPVVIMAGGKGQRLLPFTQDIPKPMVDVGGKPMLEHIVRHFIKQGFSEFYFAVNYLGHIIEEYFGDGGKLGCTIRYIREAQPLGTAGALSLIERPFDEPFIVINGDILTSVNFSAVIDYHLNVNSCATVCARAHRLEVPFGVIQLKDGMMQAIVEKPVYEDLVSAGIYVLSPEILQTLPKGKAADMPAVLQSLVQSGKKVAVFPLHEDWADIGRYDDLMQATQNIAAKAL